VEERVGQMRVFQVGPDTIDVDRFDFDWIVYWYETGLNKVVELEFVDWETVKWELGLEDK